MRPADIYEIFKMEDQVIYKMYLHQNLPPLVSSYQEVRQGISSGNVRVWFLLITQQDTTQGRQENSHVLLGCDLFLQQQRPPQGS